MTRRIDDLDLANDPNPPPAITLPSLRTGNVRWVLGTIFTESISSAPDIDMVLAAGGMPQIDPKHRDKPLRYREGDAEGAFRAGRTQLEVYLTWRDAGLITLDFPRCLRVDRGVGQIRGGMGVAEVLSPTLEQRAARMSNVGSPSIRLGILMEGADPIRTPDDLPWWVERGVCAVGMAWWKPSRYARGNGAEPSDPVGLTDLGRALARVIDEQGIVHDLSHLSQRASDELLSLTDRPVIASHSNCRALLGGEMDGHNQRHLSDHTIREIARRGGVIGLNLFCKFIKRDATHEQLPSIDDAIAHVEHICELVGHRNAVGLGSDMDGGLTADELCQGLRGPSDLYKLADALRSRGWNDSDVASFTHLNWLRFFDRNVNG